VEAETEQRSRRRARQSIREYELIWLLRQRLRAVSWALGFTGACAAGSHCTATEWEFSDLDHSHAATSQRVTRASCAQLLRSVLAWRRLPLICLKLLIGVCVRDGLAASVCVYRTSAASVQLLPRGWRAVAFPRWLHDQSESGSTWLVVILIDIARCCFGGSRDHGLTFNQALQVFNHWEWLNTCYRYRCPTMVEHHTVQPLFNHCSTVQPLFNP